MRLQVHTFSFELLLSAVLRFNFDLDTFCLDLGVPPLFFCDVEVLRGGFFCSGG